MVGNREVGPAMSCARPSSSHNCRRTRRTSPAQSSPQIARPKSSGTTHKPIRMNALHRLTFIINTLPRNFETKCLRMKTLTKTKGEGDTHRKGEKSNATGRARDTISSDARDHLRPHPHP